MLCNSGAGRHGGLGPPKPAPFPARQQEQVSDCPGAPQGLLDGRGVLLLPPEPLPSGASTSFGSQELSLLARVCSSGGLSFLTGALAQGLESERPLGQ